MSKKDIFSFGICKLCGKELALKNGYCNKCEKMNYKDSFYTLFKDIIGEGTKEDNNVK